MKKIWIVDGWEGGDYPVSFVITKLENGIIQDEGGMEEVQEEQSGGMKMG